MFVKMGDPVVVDQPSGEIEHIAQEEGVIIHVGVVCFGDEDVEVVFLVGRFLLGVGPEVLETLERVILQVGGFGEVEVLGVYDGDGLVYFNVVAFFKLNASC